MIRSTSELTPETKMKDLQGWKFISPDQQKARKKFGEIERNKQKEREFVFMKKDFFSQVKAGLSFGEVGLLLFLARYMKYADGGKLTHKARRLTVSEIAKLIKKSERQVRTVLSELEKRSLLFKVKEGRNVFVDLTDDLFVCGPLNGVGVKTVKVFKVQLSEVAKKLSLNELGLFMLMLEHVHWKTHVLCDNPEEQMIDKVILWKRKDLCEATGASRNFVNNTLRKLREIRAIAEVKTVNEGIVLHPNIVSRQNPTPTWDEICDAIDKGLTKANYKRD